jgi:hypothetical protein
MRDEIPDAQASPSGPSGAVAPASTPPEVDSGAPPSAALPKEVRDRLAQMGRQIQAAEQRARAAEQRADHVNSTVDQVAQRIQQRDKRDYEAWLQSLPAEQRAAAAAQADAQAARQEVAQLRALIERRPQSGTAPLPTTTETREQYVARRQREIIAQVNSEFGVRLTGHEAELDESDEVPFITSARTLARMQTQHGGSGGSNPALEASARGEQPMDQERNGEAAPIDAGRSFSPRPVGAGQRQVTETDVQNVVWEYNQRRPGEMRKRLTEIRDLAARQAGVRP